MKKIIQIDQLSRALRKFVGKTLAEYEVQQSQMTNSGQEPDANLRGARQIAYEEMNTFSDSAAYINRSA